MFIFLHEKQGVKMYSTMILVSTIKYLPFDECDSDDRFVFWRYF
jgi:hypothetical protein